MSSLPPRKRLNVDGDHALRNNEEMHPGQFISSADGRFKLTLQPDGNLVLLETEVQVWIADSNQPHSKTLNRKEKGGAFFYVSNSGFLQDPARSRFWIAEATHTKDESYWYNTHLMIQDDGNLVILDIRTKWASSPTPLIVGQRDTLQILAGTVFEIDKPYSEKNANITFQGDGNLVIKDANGVVTWTSNTANTGASKAELTPDGNLLITNPEGRILWSANSAGVVNPIGYLQQNGTLHIVNEDPRWARFGFQPGRFPRRRKLNEFKFGWSWDI